MQDGKQTYDELERDLGRYKKKVQDDYKHILKLEAELEAWNEVKQLNQALVAAVLLIFGVDSEDKAIVVERAAMDKMLQEYSVMATLTEDMCGTRMWLQKKAGEV